MGKKWLTFAFAAVLCMGSAVTVCAAETDNAAQIVSETEQGSDIVQNVDAQEQTDDTIQEDVTQEDSIEGKTDGTAENTDYPTATLTLVWHFGEWGKDSNGNYDTGSYAEAGSLVMETKTITLDQQDENGNYYYDVVRFDYEKENSMGYFPLLGQHYIYNGVDYIVGRESTNGFPEYIDDRTIQFINAEGNAQLLRGTSKNMSDEECDVAWCDKNSGQVYYKIFDTEHGQAGWTIRTYGDAICHVYFSKTVFNNTNGGETDTDAPADSENNTNSYGGTGMVRGALLDFPIGEIDETTLNDAQKSSIQEYKEAVEKLTGVNPAYCTEFELVDIHKPDGVTDEELAEGIDITFPVWWIAPSDKIIVLHLKSDGVWELLPATAGDGKITATFTSLSPVMITKVSEEAATDGTEQGTHIHSYFDQVVAPTADTWGYTLHTCECGAQYIDTYVAPVGTGQAAASTDLISPKTGETGVPRAVACAMLAAIGAVTIAAGYKARAGHR